MIEFYCLEKGEFEKYADSLFSVLCDNMSLIAPTGNSREEDYLFWFQAMEEELERGNRRIIIGVEKESHEVVGYFQYSVRGNVFLMEEAQIRASHQGKYGIFEGFYGVVLNHMSEDVDTVEAYANKNNAKSIGILGKLGLSIVGENKRGTSYHFRGAYADLLNWYASSHTHQASLV